MIGHAFDFGIVFVCFPFREDIIGIVPVVIMQKNFSGAVFQLGCEVFLNKLELIWYGHVRLREKPFCLSVTDEGLI
ncbi:hypothetical protein D3C87_1181230 [compost metagenome]